jgi:DNA-binding LacI/PurR family transcriptional regulator
MRERSGLDDAAVDALSLGVEDGVSQGREAVRGLLDAGVQFDAIVCASDSLALGALLMVGPDIPVVGYDNTPVAEAVGLSSIEQPLDDVAAGVLRLLMGDTGSHLLDRTSSADLPTHELFEPRLVGRHRRVT